MITRPAPRVQIRVRAIVRDGRAVICAWLFVNDVAKLEIATLDVRFVRLAGGHESPFYLAWLQSLQNMANSLKMEHLPC